MAEHTVPHKHTVRRVSELEGRGRFAKLKVSAERAGGSRWIGTTLESVA
jgi:hypothetical protein